MESYTNIDKTINAFESMTLPLTQIQFQSEFFIALLKELSLFNKPCLFTKPSDFNFISISHIRQFSLKLKQSDSIRREEFRQQLNLFLKQFQFAKSLKRYFDEKIYTQLYLSCYIPHEFYCVNSYNNEETSESNKIFLTEISDVNYKIKSLQKIELVDTIKNIINELNHLNKNWTALLSEESFDTDLFEWVVKQNQLNNLPAPIQFCGYLFNDIDLKVRKCIKLAREWLNNFQKLSNNQMYFSDIRSLTVAIYDDLKSNQNHIDQLNNEIETIKTDLKYQRAEFNQFLQNQEIVRESISKYPKIIERYQKNNEIYESMLLKRKSIIESLDQTVCETSSYLELSKILRELEEMIFDQFNKMKFTNYAMELSETSNPEMINALKDFVIWSEDLRRTIADKEYQLQEKIQEKSRQEMKMKSIKENLDIMKSVVGEKLNSQIFTGEVSGSLSESEYNFTMRTYSIGEEQRRFTDTNNFLEN